MTAPTRVITAEEFGERPQPPDGSKEELVRGEIVMAPPPGGRHGDIQAAIIEALRRFAREHDLGKVRGEVGYIVERGPDVVRTPDVSFESNERLAKLTELGAYAVGAPDLAVEVVSPRDRAGEIQEKVEEYLRAGARRVWVIWPETRTVSVHRPDGTARTLGSEETLTSDDAGFEVEGLELRVAGVFA